MRQDLNTWIEILLEFAEGASRGAGERGIAVADIAYWYYQALRRFMAGAKTGSTLSHLPKKKDTNELDTEKVMAILNIMVAQGLLLRKDHSFWGQTFDVTDKGKEYRARKLLGGEMNSVGQKPKVVVVAIREDEYTAVLSRLIPSEIFSGKHRTYATGTISRSSGSELRVAVVRSPEQGPNEAHATTRNAIEDLDPAWIFLSGIGGAIPSNEFSLGDVIVATRLHDFSVGAHIQGAVPELSNRGGPMTEEVRDLVALTHGLKKQLAGWNSKKSIKLPRPPVDLSDSAFYGDPTWREKTKASLQLHFEKERRTKPIAVAGAIASDGYLVKDTEIISQWRQSARDLIAVEMELSGVYAASRQREKQYSVVAIRGISDIVGFKRDDRWTTYACNTAAAFCVSLIANMPNRFLDS